MVLLTTVFLLVAIPSSSLLARLTDCPKGTAPYLDRCMWIDMRQLAMPTAFDSSTCTRITVNGTETGWPAQVDLPELAMFAVHISRGKGNIRIGAKRQGTKYVWATTNVPVSWADWAYGEPDTSAGIFIDGDGYWYDAPSSNTYLTACEIIKTQASDCQVRWLYRYDSSLSGGSKTTHSGLLAHECIRACYDEPSCLSVDYVSASKTCLLINANERQFPITAKAGFDHFEFFCKDCSEELVNSDRVTLITSRNMEGSFPPENGFIYNAPGLYKSYISANCDSYNWLKVQFDSPVEVHVLLMQGHLYPEFGLGISYHSSFTKNIRLLYSEENAIWKYYGHEDGIAYEIPANQHHHLISSHYLREPITAMSLIVNLRDCTYRQSFKIGVYGCVLSDIPDHRSWYNPLGLESGYIMNSQTSAYDWRSVPVSDDTNSGPWVGRLNKGRVYLEGGAWVSGKSMESGFWQVDLLLEHQVTAIATQGRSGDLQFVTTFKVALSNDSYSWSYVLANDLSEKVFTGAFENNVPIRHDIFKIGRYVRVYPASYNKFVSMRFEVYGWPAQECPVVTSDGLISGGNCTCQGGSCSCYNNTGMTCQCPSNQGWAVCSKDSGVSALSISFNHLYLATHIFLLFPDFVNLADMDLKLRLGTKDTKEIVSDSEIIYSESPAPPSSKLIMLRLSKVRRVSNMKVMFSTNKSFCFTAWIQGCLAQPCPPGFVQFGKRCFWAVCDEADLSQDFYLPVCEANAWDNLAYLATVNDIEEEYFLRQLTRRYWYGEVYIGLMLNRTSNKWEWQDGSRGDFTWWTPGEPDSVDVFTHLRPNYGEWRGLISTRRGYICSVPAVNLDDTVTWRWFGQEDMGLVGAGSITLMGYSAAECMQACVNHPEFNCSSVSASHSTRTCYLYDARGTAPTVQYQQGGFSGFEYFERYFNVCNDALIWGPNGVGGDYVYGSTHTVPYTADQAQLDKRDGHFRIGRSLTTGDFLQVDLRRVVKINRIAVQGSSSIENYYCTQFKILTSNDSIYWRFVYGKDGSVQIFTRNSNRFDIMLHFFYPELVARFLRLLCVTGTDAWRLELYGCDIGRPYDVGCAVELIGWGYNDAETTLLSVNGQSGEAWTLNSGISLATLNMSGSGCRINTVHQFQMYRMQQVNGFLALLQGLPEGTVVVAATSYTIEYFKSAYDGYLFNNFGIDLTYLGPADGFTFIIKVGDPTFTQYVKGFSAFGAIHQVAKLKPFSEDRESTTANLGITSGAISVEQLSYLNGGSYYYWNQLLAKLFSNGDRDTQLRPAWLSTMFNGQWFQVDLYILHEIHGIVTQGSGNEDYKVTKFSLATSNDTHAWQYITSTNSANNRVFESNDWRLWPILTSIEPCVVARAIRLYPTLGVNRYAVRLELIGRPYDFPALSDPVSVTSSHSDGACAMKPTASCSNFCLGPSQYAWFKINLLYLYHITKLIFNTTNFINISEKNIYYSSSPQEIWRPLTRNRTFWNTIDNDIQELRLVPHIKAWLLHINFTSSDSSCVSFTFYGTKATPCPPGMVHEGEKCFYIYNEYVKGNYFSAMCSDIDWVEKASAPITKSFEDINAYAKFGVVWGTDLLIGLRQFNGIWYWDNGEKAADVKWRSTPNSNNYCAIIKSDLYIYSIDCTSLVFGGCVTKAAVTGLETCLPAWIGRPQTAVSYSNAAVKQYVPDTLRCLHYCMYDLYPVDYPSVEVVPSTTWGTCQCNTANSTVLDVVPSSSVYLYEYYCQSTQCSSSLLVNLSSVTKPLLTSQTNRGVSYTVDQAILDTQPTTGKAGSWMGAVSSITQEWLQIDMAVVVMINDIVVQGAGVSDNQYVTELSLVYKNSTAPAWASLRNDDGVSLKVLLANDDRYRYKTVHLVKAIVAQTVRIIVISVLGSYSAIRVDFRGCVITQDAAPVPDYGALGMKSGKIGSSQLKVSSYGYVSTYAGAPWSARLDYPITANFWHAWVPFPTTTLQSWFQVSFPVEYMIHGIQIQPSGSTNIYVSQYKISYSHDDMNWFTIRDEANKTKIFQGAIRQYYDYNEYSDLDPPIRTRYLRLRPVSYSQYIALRFELYGAVAELEEILTSATISQDAKVTTSIESDRCDEDALVAPLYTTTFNCSMWCYTSSLMQTLTLDFAKIYHLSSIHLASKLLQGSMTYAIFTSYDGKSFNLLAEPKTRTYLVQRTQYNETSFHFHLPPIVRAIKVEITSNGSEALSACLLLSAKGEVVQGCPPAYAQYGKRCIRFSMLAVLPNIAQSLCEADGQAWLGGGTLAKPDNIYIKNFLADVVPSDTLLTWSGGVSSSNIWQWSDGSSMVWSVWAPGTVLPNVNTYAALTSDASLTPVSTLKRYYVCQITASEKDSDVSWFHLGSQLMTVPWSETVTGYNVTECLYACLTGYVEGCASVLHYRNTEKCIFTKSTRYGGSLVLTGNLTGGDYWEMYKGGSCDSPLLLRNTVPYEIRVSSQLSSNYSADQVIYGDKPASGKAGCWKPNLTDLSNPYVEVRFVKPVTIGRMVIVGNEQAVGEYVTSFKLKYSVDGIEWKTLTDGLSFSEEFAANRDSKLPNVIIFAGAPFGKIFKLEVLSWNTSVAAQVEYFGCSYKETISCLQSPKPELSPPGYQDVPLSCFGSWTLLMRYENPSFSFDRSWTEYSRGFGSITSDYWAGNFITYYLTKNRPFYLRFDIYSSDGYFYSAEFEGFSVEDETKKFRLTVAGYLGGTASEAGMLSLYNGEQFSTADSDNSAFNCSTKYSGGWWYDSSEVCFQGKPTGLLGEKAPEGSIWLDERQRNIYPRKVIMRMKPSESEKLNIAIGKPAWRYPTAMTDFEANLVTDGSDEFDLASMSCSQSAPGNNPWILVDLLRLSHITNVRVLNTDSNSGNLHDFIVYIGKSFAEGNFIANGYTVCGTKVGAAGPGELVLVNCASTTLGRYVAVQIPGTAQTLTVCEIFVYTTEVSAVLYQPCEWNAQCTTQFAECRPAWNDTTESFQCRCKKYYEDIKGVCVPAADIRPLVSGLTVPADGIVRGYLANLTVNVSISNNDGALFPPAPATKNNFQISFFLSMYNESLPSNCTMVNDTKTTIAIVKQPALNFGLAIFETKSVIYDLNINVSPDTCSQIHYLCVILSETSASTFIPLNKDNDISCYNIEALKVCQPEIDIAVQNVSYTGPAIPRDRPGLYTFDLKLSSNAGKYNILSLSAHFTNFEAYYFYTYSGWTSNRNIQNENILPATMEYTQANSNLSAGLSKTMQVTITKGMNYSTCYNVTHICLMVKHSMTATFIDVSLQNNINCYDIQTTKDCEPDIAIDITNTTFDPMFRFIRGYYDPLPFVMNIQNNDQDVNIEPVYGKSYNFDVSVYFSSSRTGTRRRRAVIYEGPYGAVINEDPSVGIQSNSSVTFSGSVDIKVLRENCLVMKYICFQVNPGPGASYEVAADNNNIQCIDADPYKNCQGLMVKNATLSKNVGLIIQRDNVTFTVSWEKGTDINFVISIGDGTIYNWNWISANHTTAYTSLLVAVTHTYYHFGNFTASLNISNQVGYEIRQIMIIVEPPLAEVLNITGHYMPLPTPNLLSIELRARNISQLDAPVLVWCNLTFNDEDSPSNVAADAFGIVTSDALIFNHTYVTDKPDAYPTMTCQNHVSKLDFAMLVILQEPIMGTNVSVQNAYWPTLKPLSFNLSVLTGSHVYFNITFGDGSSANLRHPNRLSSSETFTIEHTYTLPGNYSLNIIAYNAHFTNSVTSTFKIIAQNIVSQLIFSYIDVIPMPPGEGIFTITPSTLIGFPTDVYVKYYMNSQFFHGEPCPNISAGLPHKTAFLFNRAYIGSNKSLTIDIYNLVSNQTYNGYLIVEEIIADLNFTFSKLGGVPREMFVGDITVSNGSNVQFIIDYGDGSMEEIYDAGLVSSKVLHVNKSYDTIGNYTVKIQGTNLVSKKSFIMPHDFIIQHRITDISLIANASVLYTPAEVDFFLTAGPSQLLLTDLHCLWTFNGKIPQYMYFKTYNTNQTFHQMLSFSRPFIGNMSTVVNCTNVISQAIINYTTEIILDDVILKSLESNGTVFWTNTSGFVLDIARFGSKACFKWDMGDSISKVMYGLPWCEQFANKEGIEFTEIKDQTMTIVHEYVYDSIGKYTVEVFAFNHVSNDTLTTLGVVVEWYCFRPNVSFSENITDKDNPGVYMKSEYFTIPPILEVDCMKTDIIDYTWVVYSANDIGGRVIHVEYQTESFIHNPRTLQYGTYYVNLTIQMHEIKDTNQSGGFYLKIIKTPLKVGLRGNKTDTVPIDSNYTLNAIDATFDPDVEANNKTGMQFQWSCQRLNSSFDLNEIQTDELDSEMLKVLENPSGCFGSPPGLIPESEGKFKVSTGLFIPNSWYYVKVEVTKDERKGETEKFIYVPPVQTPVISVRCRENCGTRKGVASRLLLTVDCFAYCGTKLGGLRYTWSLLYMQSNASHYIYDMEKIRLGAGTARTLWILPNKMIPGQQHTSAAEAWTPGSGRAYAEYDFLTNIPVSGGNCFVTPLKGLASITKFVISCSGWKEWRPVIPDAPLTYSYNTKHPSAKRVFPVSFGLHNTTQPTVFPVGDPALKFRLDVVVLIYDSVRDPRQFETSVKVLPRPEPVDDVMNSIVAQTSGDNNPVLDLMANGSSQQAASMAFSLASELNVPSELYGASVNDSSFLEAVRLTKVMARRNIVNISLQFPLKEPEALVQNNEIMRAGLAFKEELDIETLEMGSGRLDELTMHYRNFKRDGKVEDPVMIADDLVTTTARCMGAAGYLLASTMQQENMNNNESDFTTLPPVFTEMPGSTNDMALKTKNVMRSAVNVLNVIAETLVEDKEPGDPDSVIEKEEVAVLAATILPSDMKNATSVTTLLGALILPPANHLFQNATPACLDRKVYFVRDNPYIYGNQTDIKVGSAVVRVKVSTCDEKVDPTARRHKRQAATDLQPSASFTLSLANANVPEPKLINVPYAGDLILHTLQISDPVFPVQMTIKPTGLEIFSIYVDINKLPTVSSHRWNYTLPKLANDTIVDENVTLNDRLYTITLPSKMIEDVLNWMNLRNNSKETESEVTSNPTSGFETTAANFSYFTTDNRTMYIGVQRKGCLPDQSCEENGNISYNIQLSEIKVQQFDDESELWIDIPAEVLEDSEPDRINFKSNLFGNIGAGMFTGPNRIDFSTVFDNLGEKLIENMPVVATVIGVILLYFLGTVVCHRLDKADAFKWAVLPLIGNPPAAKHQYEVYVYTGKHKHASTNSAVFFVLSGTNGDTGIRRLQDGQRKAFQRGEINSFLLCNSFDLGELMTMRIWHDGSGEGNKCGWYLEKVVVVNRQRGVWSVFNCDKWLDEDKFDNKTERLLRVMTHNMADAAVLFRQNLNRKLFDDHLWLSLGGRRSVSNFTRTQRLSVCLALLYLTMITNAMFYKGVDEKTQGAAGVITIGPISISVNELINSIKASLIVVPPVLLITIFFTKSAPPRNKDQIELKYKHNTTIAEMGKMYYSKGKCSSVEPNQSAFISLFSQKEREVDRKRYPLPHWCVAFGWLLVFLSVLASAFFTILYSFQWGGVKSRAWLIAFVMSFFESVVIIQPFKVLIITVVITFMFKKDTDTKDFEDSFGKQQNWFDIYSKPESLNLPETDDTAIVEEVKQKQVMAAKASTMLREIITQTIFLIILLIVAYSNQDAKSYRQHNDLVNTLSGYRDIDTWHKVIPWLKENVIHGLYYTHDYRGVKVSKYDGKFLANMYAMRLGPPKLRQIRVLPERCAIPKVMKLATKRCTYWYNTGSTKADHNSYNPRWKSHVNQSSTKPTTLEKAFLYQTASDLLGMSVWGYLASYEGGGYVANLGQNLTFATNMLQQLNTSSWLDHYTRAVLLEFNVLNIQSGLFTQIILSIELPPVGGGYHWLDLTSVQLYRYSGAIGVFAIVAELASVLMCVIVSGFTVKLLFEERSSFFKQPWNYVQLLVIICFFTALSFYAYRTVWTVRQVEYMMHHWGDTVNFQRVTLADRIFMMFLGLTIFFMMLQYLHLLRYNHTIAMLGATLAQSARDISSMAFCVFIVLMAFTFKAYLAFGPRLLEYSSIKNTIVTLMSSFLGHFNFESISMAAGLPGKIFLLFYLLTMILIFINFFVTLLCNFMDAVRGDEAVIPRDHEVVKYMLDSVKAAIVPEDQSDQQTTRSSESTARLDTNHKIPYNYQGKKVIYSSTC